MGAEVRRTKFLGPVPVWKRQFPASVDLCLTQPCFKVTVKFVAVAAIFFVSGVTIDGNELMGALSQVKRCSLNKVARRQNLIHSFPWIAPGWRAGVGAQSKERKG